MIAIVPAKHHSSRVPSKNWRDFHNGQNLVEIKLRQLLDALPGSQIYLSSDSEHAAPMAAKLGVHFLPREPHLASDDTPWPDAFAGIIASLPVPDDTDVAWVEVINPLYSDYAGLISHWGQVRETHDSLVLASEVTKFLLNGDGQPLNFQYGRWHAMSQHMTPLYAWDSACVMRKRDMQYFSYPIGRKVAFHPTGDAAVDIDTPAEFELAQILYARRNGDL